MSPKVRGFRLDPGDLEVGTSHVRIVVGGGPAGRFSINARSVSSVHRGMFQGFWLKSGFELGEYVGLYVKVGSNTLVNKERICHPPPWKI